MRSRGANALCGGELRHGRLQQWAQRQRATCSGRARYVTAGAGACQSEGCRVQKPLSPPACSGQEKAKPTAEEAKPAPAAAEAQLAEAAAASNGTGKAEVGQGARSCFAEL